MCANHSLRVLSMAKQFLSIWILLDTVPDVPALGECGLLLSPAVLTTKAVQATVAERHGRRTVLVVSLFGSAVTCAIFGTSTSIQQALCIRLLQGVFAGAVGVARGSVAFVTDPSNEGRAYAILG